MNNRPIVNLYRIDPDNVGDLASTPRKYFDFGREIRDRDLGEEPLWSDIILAGGGGQFQFPKVGEHIKKSILSIGWGIGSNHHHVEHATPPPEWSDQFTILGSRDKDAARWVPCASCMSPEFDPLRSTEGRHEFVLYDHWLYGTGFRHPQFEDIPRATNRDFDFSKTLEFLASGRTVITTSYHGAYWATLLGRRCVVVNPWSSKFYTYRHAPELASEESWRDAAGRSTVYPSALDECREANLNFFEDVKQLLNNIP